MRSMTTGRALSPEEPRARSSVRSIARHGARYAVWRRTGLGLAIVKRRGGTRLGWADVQRWCGLKTKR
ncbi:hypothetical protein KCP78_20530 [Salmonella enterica subsp. enterica]|nr:hypothetical protein KCP78_20530 [Salmonella enterica subsp. enterica]